MNPIWFVMHTKLERLRYPCIVSPPAEREVFNDTFVVDAVSVISVRITRNTGETLRKNIHLARAVTLIRSHGTVRRGEEERGEKDKNSPASISIWRHRSRQNGVSNLGETESMSFHRQATYHPAISQDNRCRGPTFCTISPITVFSVREGLLRKRERKRQRSRRATAKALPLYQSKENF